MSKIDEERLSLFDLEGGERAIETAAGWMPLAFANVLGIEHGSFFPTVPPDGAMGLFHEDWFGLEASEERASLFGLGATLAHVLTLVTDTRFVWLPLDTEAAARSSAYPTFTARALGPRTVDLSSVEFVEIVSQPASINLSDGFSTSSFVRMQLTAALAPYGGEPYPIWDPAQVPGTVIDGNELQFWVSTGNEFVADLLALALTNAGVRSRPPDMGDQIRATLPKWKPAYQRVADG